MDLGQGERGYAMAALLVALSVMAILMGAAMPVWSHMVRREKEAELIWRGEQYVRAIALFQRKYANTFPPNVDVLVEQRFLRKKYKDPITGGDFQIIPAGAAAGVATPGVVAGLPPTAGEAGGGAQSPARPGPLAPSLPAGIAPTGIQGVVSKSTESSIRMYNGRTKYNEWFFIHLAGAQRIGGAAGPGGADRPGAPNLPRDGRPPTLPGMLQPGGTAPGPFVPPGGIDRRPPVPGASGTLVTPSGFGVPLPPQPAQPPFQPQPQQQLSPQKPPAAPRPPR
jgi:type II secretory pathway pseudopilin PulG